MSDSLDAALDDPTSVAEASAETAVESENKSGSKSRFDRRLVEGSILQAVWIIAWPTMLQNLIAGLQGLVDHVMVGHHVGHTGNAAIGVSWQIFIVVIVFIASVFSGMGVLVARFAGADRPDKVARVVYQVFALTIVLGLFVFAPLGLVAAPSLLNFVNAEAAVQGEALPYLRIMFAGSFVTMLFFMLSGALRAAGDAKTPLRMGLVLTVMNISFNVVLIAGLGPIPALGTRGAALGTVLANALVASYAAWRLFRGGWIIDLRPEVTWKPDLDVLRRVFSFGLPTGFQGMAMNLGGVILMRYVGSLEHSAEAQAAYAVGYTQLFSFASWTAMAMMSSASTIVGQSLGAEKPDRAVAAPWAATRVGLCVAIWLALAFVLVPEILLRAFGMEDPLVLGLGRQLLGFLALSTLFLTTALSYTGALQGTGDTRSPMYISILSQLILPIGLCAALDAFGTLQPIEIWSAIVLGHFLRALLSILRFQQGKWRSIRVELGEG
ncbi:MAG: MATE family efflux transporter [Thermoanaerobaculia bacterium]|nr:MATE family efflux transporter [Thermoanaerobaculia bacterium]